MTYRIDEGGRRLERLAGIRVATSSGEWTWTTTTTNVATDACDADGTKVPPQVGRVTRAALRKEGRTRDEQVVVTPPPSPEQVNEIRHEVALAASLGPFLFVEDSVYTYACGAHGTTSKAFVVWDAERRAPADVLGTVPDRAGLVARASRLLEAGGTTGLEVAEDGQPRLTEILPVLSGEQLSFVAQVTVPDCYACSDGSWGSYARSVRLAAAPPPALAARATVPEGVARFARAHPDLTVGGWSSIPVRMDHIATVQP